MSIAHKEVYAAKIMMPLATIELWFLLCQGKHHNLVLLLLVRQQAF